MVDNCWCAHNQPTIKPGEFIMVCEECLDNNLRPKKVRGEGYNISSIINRLMPFNPLSFNKAIVQTIMKRKK